MVSVVQLRPQTGAAALRSARRRAARPPSARCWRRRSPSPSRSTPGRRCPPASRRGRTRSASPPGLASIGVDPVARAAGVLFAAPKYLDDPEQLARRFGSEIAGARRRASEKLYQLRVLTRASAGEQNEILRKMVLGMVEDIRVVLIRLASRTQTLRWFAKNPSEERKPYARESLDIYCAARQPPRRLAAQVGAGGPVVPLPRTRAVQEDRADAGREARRAGAVHRRCRLTSCRRKAERTGPEERDHRPPQAHLFHLEQDAPARSSTSPTCTTCARCA